MEKSAKSSSMTATPSGFRPYDLACIEANDRIGGELMYQMLQTGEWQIADTCPRLIEAIPTRMHEITPQRNQ